MQCGGKNADLTFQRAMVLIGDFACYQLGKKIQQRLPDNNVSGQSAVCFQPMVPGLYPQLVVCREDSVRRELLHPVQQGGIPAFRAVTFLGRRDYFERRFHQLRGKLPLFPLLHFIEQPVERSDAKHDDEIAADVLTLHVEARVDHQRIFQLPIGDGD